MGRKIKGDRIDVKQRSRALRMHMMGNARKPDGSLQRPPPPVTLPTINVLTLSEIEAKYADLDRASGDRPEMTSRA